MNEHETELVACPECKRSDRLYEQALRYTFQPVRGLKRDGEVDDYDAFDYTDDVVTTGYSCDCGWYDSTDPSKTERDRIESYVGELLAKMPEAGTDQ